MSDPLDDIKKHHPWVCFDVAYPIDDTSSSLSIDDTRWLVREIELLRQQFKHTTLKCGAFIEVWPAPTEYDGKWYQRWVRVSGRVNEQVNITLQPTDGPSGFKATGMSVEGFSFDKLRDSLDGFFAMDMGCDSGIRDDLLRSQVWEHMNELEPIDRKTLLDRIYTECFQEDKGYTEEDHEEWQTWCAEQGWIEYTRPEE